MADVATNFSDWSTTASSNLPGGSTNVGTGLDNNLQQIQATVRAALGSKGADITSASTTDLGAVAGLFHDITGTTTITSFGSVTAGIWKFVKFEGILTITYNGTSMILLGGTDRITQVGDVGLYISEGGGNWRELFFSPVGSGAVPTGTVLPYAGTAAPSGFLLCYGQVVAQATYPNLYAVLGTTYGVDTGGNFTLPDLRGRVVAGQDDMGGSSANRLTLAATGGIDGDVLGGTGGEEAHQLTTAELAPHTHTMNNPITLDVGGTGSFAAAGSSYPYLSVTATGATGGNNAHNNVQPTIIMNYVIKT